MESEQLKVDAFRDLYKDHGPQVIDAVVTYHRAHAGISRVVKIEHAHKVFLNIDLTPEALDRLCRQYSEIVENKVVECAGVPGALAFLQAAKGRIKMFVVSGTPEDELNRITDQRGISHYFDGIYGSPRKKEDIVTGVLAEQDLTLDHCLFIGDSMTDYKAASFCGMPFLGRLHDGLENPFPEGTSCVPDLLTLARIAGLETAKDASDGR